MNDGPKAANPEPRVNLDDTRALISRARKHFAEFNALLFPHEGQGLWQTTERRDQHTGEFCYQLHMDRQKLIEAKPIIADSATNIASALDHIAAAIAKANGHGRLKTLYFPWGFTDEAFDRALAKVEPVLGTEMAGVLADAREMNRHNVHPVEAAKQISSSGKHWEMLLTAGAAHGVALHVPGSGQRIFQVPADAFDNADAFEYHRGAERLPRVPISIVVGLKIGGLDDFLPNSPDSILECSFRFVDAIIAAVEAAKR